MKRYRDNKNSIVSDQNSKNIQRFDAGKPSTFWQFNWLSTFSTSALGIMVNCILFEFFSPSLIALGATLKPIQLDVTVKNKTYGVILMESTPSILGYGMEGDFLIANNLGLITLGDVANDIGAKTLNWLQIANIEPDVPSLKDPLIDPIPASRLTAVWGDNKPWYWNEEEPPSPEPQNYNPIFDLKIQGNQNSSKLHYLDYPGRNFSKGTKLDFSTFLIAEFENRTYDFITGFSWTAEIDPNGITQITSLEAGKTFTPDLVKLVADFDKQNPYTRVHRLPTFVDNGNLSPANQVNFFAHSGVPDKDFFAWINNALPSNQCHPDTVLGTFDDSNRLIRFDDNSSPVGDGFASALRGNITDKGFISLAVTGAPDLGFRGNHEQRGNYELYVKLYEGDPLQGTPSSSNKPCLPPPQPTKSYSGTIKSGFQADKYKLQGLRPGSHYYAWTNNDIPSNRCNPNTYLGVYNNLNQLTYHDQDSSLVGDGFAAALTGIVPDDGIVNVEVSAPGGRNGEDRGHYEFYVKVYEESESPPIAVGASGGGGVSFERPRPGRTQQEPILPTGNSGGWQVFRNVPSCRWYDPHTTYGFEFEALEDTLFTEILDFPVGLDSSFTVSVADRIVGEFGAGDSLDFVSLFGSGVSKFKITGIDSLVGSTPETAFPIQLAFNHKVGSFQMRPIYEEDDSRRIPEPAAIFGLLALGTWAAIQGWKISKS